MQFARYKIDLALIRRNIIIIPRGLEREIAFLWATRRNKSVVIGRALGARDDSLMKRIPRVIIR